MRRRLVMLTLVVAAFYLLILAGLWLSQDAIVFPGRRFGTRPVTAAGVRSIALESAAGSFRVAEALPAGRPAAVLVFFVGNGEDLQSAGYRAALFARHGLAVVCPEYPGYGASAGDPSVATLLEAARITAAHAAVRARELGVPLVAGGISLGTFCATDLAAAGLVERVLLLAPPSTMLETAGQHYWWLPLSLLLRHRFDNLTPAAQVRCPAMVVHGAVDAVVPCALGERVHAALGGPKEWLLVPGAGHNNLPLEPTTAIGARIGAFLCGR